MMNKKRLVLVFTLVGTTIFLLAWLACSVARSVSETDLIADSSIVWYEFPTHAGADYRIVSVTIVCRHAKSRAVVKLERWREVTTYDVPFSLESYLQLWRVLTENRIWELPSGEFLPYLELLEARGSFFPRVEPIEPTKGDYPNDQVAIDASIVGVKIRAGARTDGFCRYWIHGLKDQRYVRIQTAVWDSIDLRSITARERQDRDRKP